MDKEDVIYICMYVYTHIHIMKYYSVIKKDNNAICSNMDEPRDYHTMWSKPDKDKHHVILLICGIWKKDTNELIDKTETDSQTQKTNLWLPKGKVG